MDWLTPVCCSSFSDGWWTVLPLSRAGCPSGAYATERSVVSVGVGLDAELLRQELGLTDWYSMLKLRLKSA